MIVCYDSDGTVLVVESSGYTIFYFLLSGEDPRHSCTPFHLLHLVHLLHLRLIMRFLPIAPIVLYYFVWFSW